MKKLKDFTKYELLEIIEAVSKELYPLIFNYSERLSQIKEGEIETNIEELKAILDLMRKLAPVVKPLNEIAKEITPADAEFIEILKKTFEEIEQLEDED